MEKLNHKKRRTDVKWGLQNKRIEFVQKMMDLLYTYQDVTDGQENMLFTLYENELEE